MKINKWFIAALVAGVVLLFVMQQGQPPRYDWKQSFSPYDANPYASMLFDSVMRASMPNGYEPRRTTFSKLTKEKQNVNILYVDYDVNVDSFLVDCIDTLTKRGCKVMMAINYTYLYSGTSIVEKECLDKFGICVSNDSHPDINELKQRIANHQDVMKTVYWNGEGTGKQWKVMYQLVNSTKYDFYGNHKWQTLAYIKTKDNVEKPVVLRRKMNKGELIIVNSPLLFTNYSILNGESSSLIASVMGLVSDKPVVRITWQELTQAEAERQSTPFRAIFRSRPLTWALYTTLVVLLLFFIFTARRRQRAIPVIKEPQNHTLEFTRLIGTLFYQQHDHAGLVRRKWELFAATLRQRVGVDVQSLDDDDTLFSQLAARTGMTYEDIASTIKSLRFIVLNENDISPRQMTAAIDRMNEILEKTN